MKPEELKYNPSHEWVGVVEEDGQKIAVVGITDFAIEQLTDLVYMALPKVGRIVKAGEEFGEVESVKAVSPLYSPVSGEVVAVHAELVDKLDQLGQDPFGDGWIIKVKLAGDATLDGLLDYAAYKRQCSES
jgi:glycine cleavage system H protein